MEKCWQLKPRFNVTEMELTYSDCLCCRLQLKLIYFQSLTHSQFAVKSAFATNVEYDVYVASKAT